VGIGLGNGLSSISDCKIVEWKKIRFLLQPELVRSSCRTLTAESGVAAILDWFQGLYLL
jgi:hypothetical protein